MMMPRYIELETSRFCNRSCAWCPNSTIGARTEQELMPWSLFVQILNELGSWKYDGWLAFHNYNEPLANPRLFEELAAAKGIVPDAKTSIFSNGDFLTKNTLEELSNHRVAYVRVTLYPSDRNAFAEPSDVRLIDWLVSRNFERSGSLEIVDVRQGRGVWTSPRIVGAWRRV